jgi:hypothetical protein
VRLRSVGLLGQLAVALDLPLPDTLIDEITDATRHVAA